VITIATLAVSANRRGAVWITGPMGRGNLTHTAAVIFDDVDEEYDRLQESIADRYLYAPTPEAAAYARSLGDHPASIRNLSEPARRLQETVWRSHRNQVCNDPSVQHGRPRMRPVPASPPVPASDIALATAPVAANHVLAVWQAWLDAECERAMRYRPGSGDLDADFVRILPDEFVLAELPAGMRLFG
jgi:hypothetical protein